MSYVTLTIVRHGETDFNVAGLVQGDTDNPLNDLGIKQSQQVGAHLANEKYTRIYSSDLMRAYETCSIIVDHLKHPSPPIKREPNLREKTFGIWEGKLTRDMQIAAREAGTDMFRFHPPGSESHEEAMNRGMLFFEKICKICDEAENNNTENILAVSHGMQILGLLMHLNSKKDKFNIKNLHKLEGCTRKISPNTGKTILRIYKQETPEISAREIKFVCLMDGSHMEE